jgi:signal transduction histidine kinase
MTTTDAGAPDGGAVAHAWRPLRGFLSAPVRTRTAAGWLAFLLLITVLTWLVPALRLSWYSPTARVMLESVELCVALFAALALLLPDDGDTEVARNAFITALVTLGVSNVVFGVGPLLAGTSSAFGGVRSFYPWLAARYLVGLLFIAAALGRPRLRLAWYLLAVPGALVVVDLGLLAVRRDLPSPFVELDFSGAAGVIVPIAAPAQTLFIAVVPALLFLVGAWLAAGVFARGASPMYWFLALALAAQAAGKVHETLYPSVLGPAVTSSDLLRGAFVLLLLAGALTKVRQVVVDRGQAVDALATDLRAGQHLLARMREFTDREASFRAVVVHELATPLATLRAYAHALTDDAVPPEAPTRRQAADGLRRESARLQQLVARMDELRTLELEEFAADLRPVRLRPLLDDVATFVRGLPGGHQPVLSWRCDDDRVLADPVRLGQSLRNIAANAARYSPPRSLVTLTCRQLDAERVEVAVVDEGPGIPVAERERVLGRFERGSAAQGADGAGLGLYVAARIAQAHGGRLTIADGPGDPPRGARVGLELRRAG